MRLRIVHYLKYASALWAILLFHPAVGQHPSGEENSEAVKTFRQESKHTVYAEIGGRTFVWGSMNYEYAFGNRIAVGGGLGMINLMSGEISRFYNGATETGKYLDIATTQMIYGNYFVGKNRHQIYFTGGLTNFLVTYRNKYPSETVFSAEAQLEWNAGIGYQFSGKRTFFRITGYCISMPGPSDWFPEFMPWAGVSVGFNIF